MLLLSGVKDYLGLNTAALRCFSTYMSAISLKGRESPRKRVRLPHPTCSATMLAPGGRQVGLRGPQSRVRAQKRNSDQASLIMQKI